MAEPTNLHTAVVNALEEQIAVIDQAGTIIDFNRAWAQFGLENGLPASYPSLGCNYLEVLVAAVASGDDLAGKAAKGIQDVVGGECSSFHIEYPCHSPHEKRWFKMRVCRLSGQATGLFVISHHNITLRKLAEERADDLALRDPLTGLANRRQFDQTLSAEMRRSARYRRAISLIAVDVDHFKSYNDEFGHLAGDQCLVNVGNVLLAHARRPGDLAVRLGGDEFAVVMGFTGGTEAQQVAQEIRRAIEDLPLVLGQSRQITVSVGVATRTPVEHENAQILLGQADEALYRAKSAGRNQVVATAAE